MCHQGAFPVAAQLLLTALISSAAFQKFFIHHRASPVSWANA